MDVGAQEDAVVDRVHRQVVVVADVRRFEHRDRLLVRDRAAPAVGVKLRWPRRGRTGAALQGLNRYHAIFAWSEHCIVTYPGDMATALDALDAMVRVRAANAHERTIPIQEFHRFPGDTPQRDTNLEHGELIVAIELPKSTFAKNSYY